MTTPFDKISCDVLVVGAGPAGSCAARAAAHEGSSVVMLDRRPEIGAPARCAGHIPAAAGSSPELRQSILSPVKGMIEFHPDGRILETATPGSIVDRALFDQMLARSAAAAGATMLTHSSARSHADGVTLVRTLEGNLEIEAGVTVGADGATSTAGGWIGSDRGTMVVGAQVSLRLVRPLDHTRVYYGDPYPGGYAWLFPAGDRCNVGAGVERGGGVKVIEALEYFVGVLREEGLVEGDPESPTGGYIPVGGLRKLLGSDIILAGDAAGLCHPLTGAGIAMALDSGRLAGLAAAAAVKQNSDEPLRKYAAEIKAIYEEALSRAAGLRRMTSTRK